MPMNFALDSENDLIVGIKVVGVGGGGGNAINRMISILEPVMLIVLAVIITIVLAAVMLPIYSMYSSML